MRGLEELLYELAKRDDPRGLGYLLMATDHWAAGDKARLAVRDRLADLLIVGDPLEIVEGKRLIGLQKLEALLNRRPPTVLLQTGVARVTVGLRHSQEDVERAVVEAQRTELGGDARATGWGMVIALPLVGTRVGLRRALREMWPRVAERQQQVLEQLQVYDARRRYTVVNPEAEWAFRHLILRQTWAEIAHGTIRSRATGKTRSYRSVQAAVTRFWRRRGFRSYYEDLWRSLAE